MRLRPASKHLSRLALATAALVAVVASSIPSPAGPSPAPKRARLDAALRAVLADAPASIPVVVRFASRPTAADARAMRAAGFAPGLIRYSIVPAVAATGSARAIRALVKNPRVTYIELDAKLSLSLDRAVEATRAKSVWTAEYSVNQAVHTGGFDGSGIGIAVVDSGIDATHPDLLWKPLAEAQGKTPKVTANYKMAGRNQADPTRPYDEDLGTDTSGFIEANTIAIDAANTDNTGGHGTHVAGIAAGTGTASEGRFKGSAPGANLIGFGVGEGVAVALALAGFDYIHAHHAELGIHVVTNSWGAALGGGNYDPDASLTMAVQRLVNDDGLVVLFAAGNSGGTGSAIATAPTSNIPEVISVANYYDRSGWVDSSSSRGLKSDINTWPDVAAPGTYVISASATAGPVTYVGSGQDALINHLLEDGEPDVVPLPPAVPVTTEQDVAGQRVIAGPYASFTGTSMATPLVAGIVALMLEANPGLTPAQVREILRETANMPEGRSYQADGYAVGKGVVDATEAVAVALRLRDGDSLKNAFRNAYADTGGATAKLNLELPRRVAITSPSGGDVSGTTLSVGGSFSAGPTTDNSIPLAPPLPPPPPPPPPVQGDPRIYQGGAVDVAAGTRFVVQGEPVSLSLRSLRSNDPSITMTTTNTTASHVVKKDGVPVYGPLATTVAADGTALRSDSPWVVPFDAEDGLYTFEGHVTVNSVTYLAGSLPFYIGLPPAPPPPASRPAASHRLSDLAPIGVTSATFFSEDFEDGQGGWTIENDGVGPGLLTEWNLVTDDSTFTTWNGFQGDESHGMFWAGTWAAATFSGIRYDDFADTDLISPLIDLTAATSANLSYWRSGMSEADFDFLRVYAKAEGSTTWTKIDERSGDPLGSGDAGFWEESVVALTAFAGSKIQLRFGFTSDAFSLFPNLAGWFVDDIAVTGVAGPPTTTIIPKLSASPAFGIDALATTFAFGGESNGAITGYSLDFGDGSPAHTSAAAGSVAHTYTTGGQYAATLTVSVGSESASTTLVVDVARTGHVEVRIAGRPWVDAGVASSSWSANLDISGLAGPHLLEVRYYDPAGNRVTDSRTVNVV